MFQRRESPPARVILAKHRQVNLRAIRRKGANMSDTMFCYCCRVHHARDQMRLFPTRQGNRWRCVRSIDAAAGDLEHRDHFGKQQTRINQEASRRAAEFQLHTRLGRRSRQ